MYNLRIYLIITFVIFTVKNYAQCSNRTFTEVDYKDNALLSYYFNITDSSNEQYMSKLKLDVYNVQKLTLSTTNHNILQKISQLMPLMNNLEMLELSMQSEFTDTSDISDIFDGCTTLRNLKWLEISFSAHMDSTAHEYIPVTIDKLQHIRVLKINSEFIKELPQCINKLKELEYVFLQTPRLKVLPDFFSSEHLKNIQIRSDDLYKIPDFKTSREMDGIYLSGKFYNLFDFTGDWINSNSIDTFSVEFTKVKEIRFSSAKEGPVYMCLMKYDDSLEVKIDFSNVTLPRLKTLYLFTGKCSYINFNGSQLPLLKSLELFCDGVDKIEKNNLAITNVPIESLALINAFKLKSLGELGRPTLRKVTIYDLKASNLKSVIDELSEYKKLEILEVSPNSIGKIPKSLKKLSFIKELIIKKSPFDSEKIIIKIDKNALQKLLPNTKITINE